MSDIYQENDIEMECEIESDMEADKLWTRFIEIRKDWLRELTHRDMVELFGEVDTEEMIREKRDVLLREVRGVYHSLIEKELMFPEDKTCHNMIEFHIIVENIQDSALILDRFIRIKKDSSTLTRKVFNWYIGMDQEVVLNIGDQEDITLGRFMEPMKKHVFPSREHVNRYFEKYAPRAIRFLRGVNDSYLVRIHKEDDLVHKPLHSFTSDEVKIRKEPREGEIPGIYKVSMSKLLVENLEFIPEFSKKVFKPLGHGLREGEYNIWTGFKFTPVETINMDKVQPFIDHITQVWANGNRDHANYILTWMATILTRPWKKTEIALLICGLPGSGKSIVTNFFEEQILGDELMVTASELTEMTAEFNGKLENRLVVGIHEVGHESIKTYSTEYNKLKSLITDPNIDINIKFEKKRTAKNSTNIILHSNSGLPLENNDRRFATFQTSPKRVGDSEYFRHLGENLKSENANHVGTYLMDIQHLMVDLKNIPPTQIREEFIETSKPAPIRFIQELREMEQLPPNIISIPKYPTYASVDDLYRHYDHWRIQNGEPAKTKIQFGRDIATICPGERKYCPNRKTYFRMYDLGKNYSE